MKLLPINLSVHANAISMSHVSTGIGQTTPPKKNFGNGPLPADVQFTGTDPNAVVLTDADLVPPGPGEVSRELGSC